VTGATVAAAALAGASVLVAGDAAHVVRSRVRRLPSSDPAAFDPALTGPAMAGPAMADRARADRAPRSAARHGDTGSDAGGQLRRRAGLVTGWAVAATAAVTVAAPALGRGPVIAAGAALLALTAGRRRAARSASDRRQREIAAALPRFADLVAACLESGAAPADALDVVRRQLVGPLADRLAPVVGALRSGVDPLTVYGGHAGEDPLRGLVVALARAMESGAPLADMMAAVADDQRRRRRWSAEAAARRAGVHAVGPLVVCFLPAFVLLGVVPVVLGIAAEVLGDLS
jgi:Flp pilus assembly protein TadB